MNIVVKGRKFEVESVSVDVETSVIAEVPGACEISLVSAVAGVPGTKGTPGVPVTTDVSGSCELAVMSEKASDETVDVEAMSVNVHLSW